MGLTKHVAAGRGERRGDLDAYPSPTRAKKSIPCCPSAVGSGKRASLWCARDVMKRYHPRGAVAASRMLSSGVCLAVLRRSPARASRR
jgi:hypothetical protein